MIKAIFKGIFWIIKMVVIVVLVFLVILFFTAWL